ncbi:MAG: ATP-binding protein [Nostoc sp. EfeVER01]|uniref:ATP-binding protein n=1 Tax=unclassified Nostoc TaxID=2593658 RepID=UPI002AD27395|nr:MULTISPECIES: ATP-binding protein [unclassified Nostoc]MDZ7947565.1 ATP-binding protein [Nostoc sp. EfeVER01]MDZ7994211.1 ATP-binding protein [Nostoc sp. EspVER01]
MDHLPNKLPQDLFKDLKRDFQVINRALRVLSACTQAVIRAVDEATLLQTLCHLITEEAAYRMAWVGYVCHDEAKTVEPVVWAGYEAEYLKTVNITWANTLRGQGPTGRAIRSRRPIACQNMLEDPNFAPWREAAQQRGYQSSLVIPLFDGGEVFGTLNIYSSEADAFNPQELALLTELSDSLSFGILALRAKQKRQQLEQSLKLSEDKFAKAFYSSPIAKSITTLDEGRYLDVNHSFEWLFGYVREEVLERTALEVQIWQKADDRQYMLQELKFHRKLRDYEAKLQKHNGEQILCYVSAELIQIEETICILSAIENITERRQAELMILRINEELEQRVTERTAELTEATKKLQLLNQELQQSNQELEQFAYVASHDLQEPLRAIAGYTQLLMSEYGDRFDSTAQSYANFVVDGAKRMQQLIQDLLAYSRVGTRRKEFVTTDCNLAVQQALRNLRVAIAENQATITVEPLPTLNADQNQLVQLFQNLISNAIKFHEDNHPDVQIQSTKRDRDYLFQVKDNGIGISSQYLDQIFEVFKRLHTHDEYPGTGIGLAICKKIVTRHSGEIWAESSLGIGTTFYFTIPCSIYE